MTEGQVVLIFVVLYLFNFAYGMLWGAAKKDPLYFEFRCMITLFASLLELGLISAIFWLTEHVRII